MINSGGQEVTEYYYCKGSQGIETRNGWEYATRQFVFGTQYVDEPIRMDADNDGDGDCMDTFGSEFYYYHQDANYNVVALTDSDGAVVQRYLYDSYGRLHVYDAFDTANPDRGDLASGEVLDPLINPSPGITVPNPFTYTGRFHDVEMGLYYYRARHCQPALGRFLQRDPKDYLEGLNLYAYAGATPTVNLDPFGLSIWRCSHGPCIQTHPQPTPSVNVNVFTPSAQPQMQFGADARARSFAGSALQRGSRRSDRRTQPPICNTDCHKLYRRRSVRLGTQKGTECLKETLPIAPWLIGCNVSARVKINWTTP